MKIAINCVFFQPRLGGIKEYIHNLIENLEEIDLENEYVVYVLRDQLDYAKKNLTRRFRIKTIPFDSGSIYNRIKRSIFESSFWRKEEEIEKWDIFHSPFFHAPKVSNAKLVLTVHDLRFVRFPRSYNFLRYCFLKWSVPRSLKAADQIITISGFTKSEIVSAYGVEEDKITVVHEAVNKDHFTPGKLIGPDLEISENLKNHPFILTVGHIEPRKNYYRLIKAFNMIPSIKGEESPLLVIVGQKNNGYADVIKLIEKTPGVRYLNYVSFELLSWLYANARVFVFPSIYEGFGFPPLEAAVNGLISVVSNSSCIPEICGDNVLYFNPYDIQDMKNAMMDGLWNEDIRKNLKMNLNSMLERYSWKRNAEETIKIYKQLYK